MSKTIIITHNDVEYVGEIGVIRSTRLGYEDHGIFTAMIDLSFGGGSTGQGAGFMCLDRGYKPDPDDYKTIRVGTAYGLDHIMQIMRTVGVENWEDLKGKQVIALRESRWGSIDGLAHTLNDNVLVFKEHAEQFKAQWGEQ